MFMRENRKKNGVPDPGAGQPAEAHSGQELISNTNVEQTVDWRFTPQMSTPAAINEGHYQGGISGSGPYGTSYEDKIPHVSAMPVHEGGDRSLKSR